MPHAADRRHGAAGARRADPGGRAPRRLTAAAAMRAEEGPERELREVRRGTPRGGRRARVERGFERFLFSSRWLLAPFYGALVVALAVLLLKVLQELGHFVLHAWSASEADVILGVLTLVDLSLTGSLFIIVIFSGYENFVSRIDEAEHRDWPEWMGKIDFTGLKLKLLSSIVAISAIQLLKSFMNVGNVSDRDLTWTAGIHVVFVVSGIVLALTDRISAGHAVEEPPREP